jgi:hypothetical protein
VAYHIELHEANVAPYLASLELSTEGREALTRVLDELATYGDLFLRDPERRVAPDSDTFLYGGFSAIPRPNSFTSFGLSSVMPPPNTEYCR